MGRIIAILYFGIGILLAVTSGEIGNDFPTNIARFFYLVVLWPIAFGFIFLR